MPKAGTRGFDRQAAPSESADTSRAWRWRGNFYECIEAQSPKGLTALKRAGCITFFKDEGLSGATIKRPALIRCPKRLKSGDTLVVWKLDRLGSSVRDLISILDDLRARVIRFESVTEAIDTATPTGRAMWQMIGVLAELVRCLIVERTQAGMDEARRRGIKFGRKKKLTADQVLKARKLVEHGERVEDVAALWNVGRATLYRALASASFG